MYDLITVDYSGDAPTVSGRELHEALEVKEKYTEWFKRMCDYGFRANKDWLLVSEKTETNNPKNPITFRSEHKLTIPMAKELCMLQRSEMGKRFREYFIQVEESWNSPDKIMERAWQIAHQRALEAERRIMALSDEKEELEIALNTSLKYYTVAKYNKVYKMQWNMNQCQTIGKQLAAYCRSRAIQIKQCETNDERFGNVNSYPLTAWEAFLESDVTA
jgi:phage anti-repressor protein